MHYFYSRFRMLGYKSPRVTISSFVAFSNKKKNEPLKMRKIFGVTWKGQKEGVALWGPAYTFKMTWTMDLICVYPQRNIFIEIWEGHLRTPRWFSMEWAFCETELCQNRGVACDVMFVVVFFFFSSLPELMERKKRIDMHTNIATALLDQIKVRSSCLTC